jgi:hypothetical protein
MLLAGWGELKPLVSPRRVSMERETTPHTTESQLPSSDDDRREFLKKCGKFAAVTPPAVTLLLSTALNSGAIAKSGGRPGYGKGDNNHDHYGPLGQLIKNLMQ